MKLTDKATEREVRRAVIDLSKASEYVDGEHEKLILRGLRRAGLLSKDFLYSVFNIDNEARVLANGSTRNPDDNVIYAFTREQLVWDNSTPCCLKVRFKEDIFPGIAVYDGACLEKAFFTGSSHGYSFKNPARKLDALVGVVELMLE